MAAAQVEEELERPGGVEEAPIPSDSVEEPGWKKEARDLGFQGIELYERHQYQEAVLKLERAYAQMPVATLGLWLARSLEKVGRLVEAAARYEEVVEMDLAGDAPSVMHKSQEAARSELHVLQGRIPTIAIGVRGASRDQVAVTLGGRLVDDTRDPVRVDPGAYAIEGQLGERVLRKSVVMEEGDRAELSFDFGWTGPKPAAPVSGSPRPDEPGSRPAARRWGIVSLGVGGASLLAGATLHALALDQAEALDEICPARDQCPPGRRSAVREYNRRRAGAFAGYAAAAAGLSLGTVLLLQGREHRRSAREAAPPAALGWEISPSGLGLKGWF